MIAVISCIAINLDMAELSNFGGAAILSLHWRQPESTVVRQSFN